MLSAFYPVHIDYEGRRPVCSSFILPHRVDHCPGPRSVSSDSIAFYQCLCPDFRTSIAILQMNSPHRPLKRIPVSTALMDFGNWKSSEATLILGLSTTTIITEHIARGFKFTCADLDLRLYFVSSIPPPPLPYDIRRVAHSTAAYNGHLLRKKAVAQGPRRTRKDRHHTTTIGIGGYWSHLRA
jgi:hypothetical protein